MSGGPARPRNPGRPPRLARRILRWSAPDRLVDAIDGDLMERFDARARRDAVAARRWYRREVARSVGPLVVLVLRDAPAVRWPLGLATGILVTSFAHDGVIEILAAAAGIPGSEVSLTVHIGAAGALAVLGCCAAARIAGVWRRRGSAVVVAVLYGPALVGLIRSPPSAIAALPALLVICSFAWLGAAVGRVPRTSRAG